MDIGREEVITFILANGSWKIKLGKCVWTLGERNRQRE